VRRISKPFDAKDVTEVLEVWRRMVRAYAFISGALHREGTPGPESCCSQRPDWGGAMLRFVGDVGIYLPDRDAIVFTALDGRMPVACRVRRSALTALGCSFRATPGELVDGFQSVRKFLERIVRFKWNTGRISRGVNHQPVVNIEEADIYGFYQLKDGEPIVELQAAPDDRDDGDDSSGAMWHEGSGSRLRLNLHSLRILVVEDNLLTADAIQDLLETSGCEVIGPAPTVAAALELIARTALDGAVLDISLGSELSFPVAAALIEQDIPFLFLTGHDELVVPPQYRAMRRLEKAADMRLLAEVVTNCFGQPSRLAH
jgi:CheY-like chemotaxis protein